MADTTNPTCKCGNKVALTKYIGGIKEMEEYLLFINRIHKGEEYWSAMLGFCSCGNLFFGWRPIIVKDDTIRSALDKQRLALDKLRQASIE